MAMSYIDLIVYNFRFIDASRADPFRVENLRLLTPAFDSREEHVFYLTQVEILAQSAPIVGAAVRAQEAVLVHDEGALEMELRAIEACLRHLAQRSLVTIDPVLAAVLDHKLPAKPQMAVQLKDAVKLVQEEASRRDEKYQKIAEAEKNKSKVLEAKFQELFKKAKDEPITKPLKDIDLD